MIKKKGEYMSIKMSASTIRLIIAAILPILSLATWCGVLKSEVNQNKNEIITLEALVKTKEIALQSEIDQKLDIELYNAAHNHLTESIRLLREDNTIDHQQLNDKLDQIILREIGEK